MPVYLLRASNAKGTIDGKAPLPLTEALRRAAELREQGFHSFVLTNLETGTQITDLNQFLRDNPDL